MVFFLPLPHIIRGAQQGSSFGQILFSIYALPLGHIIQHLNVSCHFYADDTQIYPLSRPGDAESLAAFFCLFFYNSTSFFFFFLQLYNFFTNISVIASTLGLLSMNIKPTARNLGVIVDLRFFIRTKIKATLPHSYKLTHALPFF